MFRRWVGLGGGPLRRKDLVENDRNGVGEIEDRILIMRGDVHQQVATQQLFLGEAEVLPAEDQGYLALMPNRPLGQLPRCQGDADVMPFPQGDDP